MRVAQVEEDLPVQQAISEWLKLPSTKRRYEQDAYNFIADNLEKYDRRALKQSHEMLASAIILFQHKIQEPLGLTPPALRMRLTAVRVQRPEPRAVGTPRLVRAPAISRKPLSPLDRASMTIG